MIGTALGPGHRCEEAEGIAVEIRLEPHRVVDLIRLATGDEILHPTDVGLVLPPHAGGLPAPDREVTARRQCRRGGCLERSERRQRDVLGTQRSQGRVKGGSGVVADHPDDPEAAPVGCFRGVEDVFHVGELVGFPRVDRIGEGEPFPHPLNGVTEDRPFQ